MVTDSRGHQVPAGSDSWGYREDMEQLSASITDVRSVADEAAATSAVADLDAADLDTEGTVWWLTSPGTLVVYTGGEFVPLPTTPDLEGHLVVALGGNVLSNTNPASDYPVGVSTMYVTGSSFPISNAVVTTIRDSGATGALQIINRVYAGVTRVLIRNGDLSAWAPWRSASAPFGQAVGSAQFTDIRPGNAKSKTVTLPSGQFTTTPYVTLGIYSTIPGQKSVSHAGKTSSGFTIYAGYTGQSTSVSYKVNWNAVQMKAEDQGTDTFLLQASVDEPEPEPDTVVVCPTDRCANQGISIAVATRYTDDDGTQRTTDAIECGVCGTDLTDTAREA